MKKTGLAFVGFGAAAAAGIAVALSAKRRPTPKIISDSTPTKLPPVPSLRPRRRVPLVAFTYRSVPYKSKKTGKVASYKDVIESPAALKAAAEQALGKPMSDEVFVLGTLIASEAGTMPPIAKIAVGHAARNAALRARKNILRQVIANGVFGSQGFNGRGYAATSQPPTAEDVEIANAVLKGLVPDPTGGAVQWDAPRVQRKGNAEGWAGYGSTPEMVAADRIRSGKEMVALPNIDPDVLRFWRPRGASA